MGSCFNFFRHQPASTAKADLDSIASSNTSFALDLYRTLSETKADAGNLFFSPLSISSALAMVYLGAKGDTADQMAKTLSFNTDTDVHSNFQSLTSNINNPSAKYQLKLTNRLYGENTYNFFPEFIEATQKFYHADLKAVDFKEATEESRRQINSWVEKQTDNKIKEILKPGVLSEMTKLVLVNAVYFKARWLHEFFKTTEYPFKVSQKETRTVQMMFNYKKFPYKHVFQYHLQVLELPYLSEELSMFFLLPDESTDGSDPLLKLERELTPKRIHTWTKRGNMDVKHKVDVMIPKFKLQEDYKLNAPLAFLGMTDVFNEERADLSGMNIEEGLYLSTVVHKTFVDVNETGTEAAASTAVDGKTYGLGSIVHYFKADHPFLFFIRHNKTKSILFMGRFASPE